MKLSKNKILSKALLMSCALLMGITATSCSSFIGEEEGYEIVNTIRSNDEEGNEVITFEFSNEQPPVTITVPKGKDGTSIKSVEKIIEDGKAVLQIEYDDEKKPIQNITLPIDGVKNIEIKEDKTTGECTLYFTFLNGNTVDYTIPKGQDGNGIKSIETGDTGDGKTQVIINFTDESLEPKVIEFDNPKGISAVKIIEDEADNTKCLMEVTYTDGEIEEIPFDKPYTNRWYRVNEDPRKSFHPIETNVSEEDVRVGDYCLNTANGDVFVFESSGKWQKVFRMQIEHEENCEVLFDLNGGKYEEKETIGCYIIKSGTTLQLSNMVIPTKEGYEFIGWFTDKTNPNAGQLTDLTVITKDMTVYARYVKIDTPKA